MLKFTAKVEGAKALAKDVRRAADGVEDDTRDIVILTLQDGKKILATHAPERTHRLIQEMKIRRMGSRGTISSNPKNPRGGFRYIAVTRFGHKKKIIRPRRKKALRFEYLGAFYVRRSVRGVRVASDWVEDAFPEVQEVAETGVGFVGEDFIRRLRR